MPFLLEALYKNLREDFAVPAVALRLWMETSARDRVEFADIGQEARVFAESITDPYFSEHPILDTGVWFGNDHAEVRSLVYVPLRLERPVGLLMLGSEDPQRFSAGMGTLYLTRLGELVSMALKRYVDG